MATERKSASTPGAKRAPSPRDKAVRVWSSVGVTLCITENPPQFLKLEFGHERLAKSSSQEELRKTATLIDEFNEAELQRRLESYKRIVEGHEPLSEDDTDPDSIRSRARRRIKETVEDEEDSWD